jgi:hypothetical protein
MEILVLILFLILIGGLSTWACVSHIREDKNIVAIIISGLISLLSFSVLIASIITVIKMH